MTPEQIPPSDERIELALGHLLRFGVVLSAIVVLTGGTLFLSRHGNEPADHRTFRGEPADLRHVTGVVKAAFGIQARGIIALGLLFLIATPIARVAFSIIAFARQKDYLYVALTVLVLVIIVYSLTGVQQ